MIGRTLAFFTTLLLGTVCVAQTMPVQMDAGNATGIQPYQTFGGARENISHATGDVNLSVPLLHIPGRNGLDLSIGMIYDSKVWDIQGTWDPSTPGFVYSWEFQGPWKMNIPQVGYSWVTYQSGSYVKCNENFNVILSDGSNHMFSGLVENCYNEPPYPGQPAPEPQDDVLIWDSNDGRFMRLDVSNSSDWIL